METSSLKGIFDVVVIGGGPGGYSAAIRAAQLGGKVALVEGKVLGGVCLNEGCIPTKFLLNLAETLQSIRRANEFGIEVGDVSLNPKTMAARRQAVVNRLVSGIDFLMKKYKIEVVYGEGAVLEQGAVEIYDKNSRRSLIKTKNIVVATGSEPIRPSIPGVDTVGVITSDQALELSKIPSSLAIIGGGPEGVEFADIFRGLGCKVTVIEMLSQLLPGQDSEIASELQLILSRKGIEIYTNSKVIGIEDSQEGKNVTFSLGGQTKSTEAEIVLLAVGRRSNALDIGLEDLGVEVSNSGVSVDEHMMTNVPGIYVVGDAAGKYLLAYTAFAEGEVAVEHSMGKESCMEYKAVPITVFTSPEVGSVGLTEYEARNQGFDVTVGRFPFRANGKAVSTGYTDGFVKVVADRKTDKLLGVHILGQNATEIIHASAIALKMNAKVKDIASTLHAHPTLSEAVKEAALDVYGMAIHKG